MLLKSKKAHECVGRLCGRARCERGAGVRGAGMRGAGVRGASMGERLSVSKTQSD